MWQEWQPAHLRDTTREIWTLGGEGPEHLEGPLASEMKTTSGSCCRDWDQKKWAHRSALAPDITFSEIIEVLDEEMVLV